MPSIFETTVNTSAKVALLPEEVAALRVCQKQLDLADGRSRGDLMMRLADQALHQEVARRGSVTDQEIDTDLRELGPEELPVKGGRGCEFQISMTWESAEARANDPFAQELPAYQAARRFAGLISSTLHPAAEVQPVGVA